MLKYLLCLALVLVSSLSYAQNPPTNYTLQTTPYNGSEQWYCEDVTHVTNKACNVTGLFSSLTSAPNLTTASLLTSTGVITTGGAAGAGFTLNAGTIAWLGAIPIINLPACYSTGVVPISCGGNGTASPGFVAGQGIVISGSWPTQTITAKNGAAFSATPSNPAATSSTSLVMAGLGSSLTVTPAKTGNVMFVIQGQISQANDSYSCIIGLRYGTGVAPVNGAAATGNVVTAPLGVYASTSSSYALPFNLSGVVAGLALSTSYWFDLVFYTNGAGGSCSVANITGSAMEQ